MNCLHCCSPSKFTLVETQEDQKKQKNITKAKTIRCQKCLKNVSVAVENCKIIIAKVN